MNQELRQATKAQATAVREYLQSLGMTLSHVQALEVIARGQGLRSRQVLAAQLDQTPAQWVDANVSGNPALVQAMKNHAQAGSEQSGLKYTRVSYGYTDGGNCKRSGSVVFRGRLTRDQLRLIASRLDEELFFVPCQIGFESLHLAFTDEGGDDHYWHKLELADEQDWTFDAEGFVLCAGDIEQVNEAVGRECATDADCDNLMWRFARLLQWDPELQSAAVTSHVYQRPALPEDSVTAEDITRLASQWLKASELRQAPQRLLVDLAEMLLEEGFLPFPGIEREVRRPVGPNAYQFCILEACDPEHGDLVVNFDVSTHGGQYLTETPVQAISQSNAVERISDVRRLIGEQLKKVRVMPATYDSKFD